MVGHRRGCLVARHTGEVERYVFKPGLHSERLADELIEKRILARTWELLECHQKPGVDHTPFHALCRLLITHLQTRYPDKLFDGLTLDKNQLKPRSEVWTIRDLESLLLPEHKTEKEPYDPDLPIIVVEYEGDQCLIDGRRRINKWIRENNKERHLVYVLKVESVPD